ncbi:Retrovirus-related Pol polyprotein from transposon RE1 [Vitis vinifera]|uniref:Retrovirus-related Pol polyprotein from transposon RE1 n=1 Tax=Vitis vinifera TaxID=29760 RepID=A0A438FV10_VITVI|nr:Retrovirus-related Pol polyprotein from transposon RE1 [Vitis vinifera]
MCYVQPSGFIDRDHPHHVCKLRKAIYGLKQAPRAWYHELRQFLLQFGFINSIADTSLFIFNNHGTILYLLVYVDDIIITGNNVEAAQTFIQQLSHVLSQGPWPPDILPWSGSLPPTPMQLVQFSLYNQEPLSDPTSIEQCQASAAVSLWHLRPRHQLRRTSPLALHAFSDSDWAALRNSELWLALPLRLNTDRWPLLLQKFVGFALLTELGVTLPQQPVIYCDNVGATNLCSNPVFHSRMKHVALDYHFIREQVQNGLLRVSHISASDQLADALTKPLARPQFDSLKAKIGLAPRPSILRGHDKDIQSS